MLDLDGTLYSGDAAVPGAVAAIARLRTAGIPFRCVTNTTSRSRNMIVARLAGYGFDITASEIFTATLAGADAARARGCRTIAPFLPAAALADLDGFVLMGGTSGNPAIERPDAVLIGDLGEAWSYAFMQEAFTWLLDGAEFVACSRDRYWLRGDRMALDCGAFVAGLEYAAGREALVAGKPNALFFSGALDSLGDMPAAHVAMVGDDLWSDVAGAQRAGLQGWAVRTGKFRLNSLVQSGIVPDRILQSVADLTP
ncbi:MAG: HAD-IIA family hydrolase [Gemmatimonadota bacterium]